MPVFYHFTFPDALKAVLRDGLLLSKHRPGQFHAPNQRPCIWLTSQPTLQPSFRERIALLQMGQLVEGSLMPAATVCLRVRLPTNSRHLVRWKDWAATNKHILRSHHGRLPLYQPNWWMYHDDIQPEQLEVLKRVRRGPANITIDEAARAYDLGVRVKIAPSIIERLRNAKSLG